jgi:acetyl-CoA synthetase (ADP-forming)
LEVIENAVKEGRTTLSEYESKDILRQYGIPVTREFVADDEGSLEEAVKKIGFPLVLKGCGFQLSHKTESDLVRIGIQSKEEALGIFQDLYESIRNDNGVVLVQEMIHGRRELVAGLVRDDQFGPCVMFGLGGIMTEVFQDVVFRPAPLDHNQALIMTESIKSKKLLGPIRGMPRADLDQLADILVKVGQIGMEMDQIKEIDINPIILSEDRPVAVDALVILNA